ncbi:2-hydroxyacid dehydrogenase [Pontibacillus marinus]|uniref:Glyoxylate/hydroxypyruvate reductase B n=1 Tax=Pontibacillus marinus BH030004 = DSM 16465 TaxID=1385511 RepID=A0A0A5GF95_9BACI|nr:D-glycerate dehydrogenase [Pontibacillus marinus]KGX89795.1 2-ketogluconate reductase [Pontibacillus marinus BH030004 = DSM 16465]
MSKPYVYITRSLPEDVVNQFRDIFDVHMWDYKEKPVDRETLLQEATKADALITMLSDKVDEELLNECQQVKVIANLAVGYDNINVKKAEEKGITITNTPDVLTETTADLTFSLLMATARRIVEAAEYVKEGQWQNWAPLLLAGNDIHHKTIGIVGMGRIGEAVAKRATGFYMDILYHNRSRKERAEQELGAKYVSFEDLLEQSDYVVCLAPLTKETKGMFDQKAFEKMKSTAIFVNASRGANVDEEALYKALEKGEIKAAGLDVFAQEPISSDHPLLQLENVVALPHIGSSSEETRKNMMELCFENIQRVWNGQEAKTKVNP